MKKRVSVILTAVLVVAMVFSFAGCSSHECSVCGTTENVHKNNVTQEDLGGIANEKAVTDLREMFPYLCDDCFDEMVETTKDAIYKEVRKKIGY